MAGAADPFAKVKAATDAHRARHGCGAYPYDNGPLLAALAAAANARRILELGTALGYTALSFASGAPDSTVDTIERDPEHVQLARDNITAARLDHRITMHEGDFAAVLPTLDPGYDVAFFDGHTPSPALHKALRGLFCAPAARSLPPISMSCRRMWTFGRASRATCRSISPYSRPPWTP